MFAMANNVPEVLRMLWYWAWFRIRKADSIHFTGPFGPESKGEAHLRVYTCLCTFLVGSLLALPAAGQSAVPAAHSEASVALPRSEERSDVCSSDLGEAHLRVYTCLCTFLVGSLLALPAAGQSAVPAAHSEASVALPG